MYVDVNAPSTGPAQKLARDEGLDQDTIDVVDLAATLHDVGVGSELIAYIFLAAKLPGPQNLRIGADL